MTVESSRILEEAVCGAIRVERRRSLPVPARLLFGSCDCADIFQSAGDVVSRLSSTLSILANYNKIDIALPQAVAAEV